MAVMTENDVLPRPPSPWRGSAYQARHRWQLDQATDLPQAADMLRALAAELTAAHTAGWWLVETMLNGHLVAARASRRRRAGTAPDRASVPDETGHPAPVWRLRLVEEPAVAAETRFDSIAAALTPVLQWSAGRLGQVSGPQVRADILAEIARQLADVEPGRWGLSPARVGRGFDLVAEGSALRLHAVCDGVLVRTREVLTFQHAADGAVTLLQAAAAYQRVADVADAMRAAGGRLTSADDGFLHIAYDGPVR